MLKRMLALVLAMMLLPLAACAQEQTCDALYLLVSRDAQGNDTPLGTAVVFMESSVLLTTTGFAVGDGTLYAVGKGGALAVNGAAALPDINGLMLLSLESPSPAAPIGQGRLEGALTILGSSKDGTIVSSAIDHPSYMPYNKDYLLLYTAGTSLLPGSIVLDSSGGLACMTLAAYSEGLNRYAGVLYDSISAAMKSTKAAPPEGVSWVTGFTATAGAGEFTVDWSACDLNCEKEDCVIGVIFANVNNRYFSYRKAEGSSVQIHAVPGETYRVWVQHAHGDLDVSASRYADEAVTVVLPQAVPFTKYAYTDLEMYLGAVPAAVAEDYINVRVPALEEITAQTLTDPEQAIFLQLHSTYDIDHTFQRDLVVALTTPEGYIFDYASQFIFDLTLQRSDVWNVDITRLLQDYLAFNGTGVMSPGQYALRYYLGGEMANELLWTLE